MDLEQKCDHFYIARLQRESYRYLKIEEIEDGYHHQGCYSCDGDDKKCKLYSKLMDYGFVQEQCCDLDLEE